MKQVNIFDEEVRLAVAAMHEEADTLALMVKDVPPALSTKLSDEETDFLLDFPEEAYQDEGPMLRGEAAARLLEDMGEEAFVKTVEASYLRRMANLVPGY